MPSSDPYFAVYTNGSLSASSSTHNDFPAGGSSNASGAELPPLPLLPFLPPAPVMVPPMVSHHMHPGES